MMTMHPTRDPIDFEVPRYLSEAVVEYKAADKEAARTFLCLAERVRKFTAEVETGVYGSQHQKEVKRTVVKVLHQLLPGDPPQVSRLFDLAMLLAAMAEQELALKRIPSVRNLRVMISVAKWAQPAQLPKLVQDVQKMTNERLCETWKPKSSRDSLPKRRPKLDIDALDMDVLAEWVQTAPLEKLRPLMEALAPRFNIDF